SDIWFFPGFRFKGGEDAWAFIQLNQAQRVRYPALDYGVRGMVHDGIGVERARAGAWKPFDVERLTGSAHIAHRMPAVAATAATLQQQFVFLSAAPVFCDKAGPIWKDGRAMAHPCACRVCQRIALGIVLA